MTAANAVAWFAQIAVIVAACAALPRLVGLRSATLQHVFWRAVLTLCLVLPVIEPKQPHQMLFVPAAGPAPAAIAAQGAGAAPARASTPIDWGAVTILMLIGGTMMRLAWLAAGLVRLRRLRRGAQEYAQGFDDLRQTIGAGDVPILWSSDAPHPVTFGALRPVILLPTAIKAVDRAAQHAVVAHELHHVKRRDWLWTLAEEIVRAFFWFHPAMWWLISRVQLARETVVDELSILTTNARRAYLDTLLAFADDTGLQSSAAFSARRHLFHRVMLLSKEETMSSIRIASASCVLAVGLATGTWSAVSAFPLHGAAVLSQVTPPPLPAPPPGAQTREAHHQVATFYLEIAQKHASLTPQERLEAIVKGIAAEDRALAIDPNYVPALIYKNVLLREQANLTADPSQRERLLVEADELRQTAIVLRGKGVVEVTDPSAPPPPPPPPPPGSGTAMLFMPDSFERNVQELAPVPIGGDLKAPVKIRDVRPAYPPIAQQARVQGTVIVEALIGADGSVVDARVLRSIPLLDQAALEAVRQWRFTPPVLKGEPHAVLMTVTVTFRPQ